MTAYSEAELVEAQVRRYIAMLRNAAAGAAPERVHISRKQAQTLRKARGGDPHRALYLDGVKLVAP